MYLEKILNIGKKLLATTLLSTSLAFSSFAQSENNLVPIPVDQSCSWFRPVNGVLTCKNKSNTTAPSAQFASQYTVTNTFYLTGKTTDDGCLNIGFFSTDPRNPKKTSHRIDYANSKLYLMCPPDTEISSNAQYAETINLGGRLESLKLVPKEEMRGFWARTQQKVLQTLEDYDPSRKFLDVYTLGTATDYCFSELIQQHARDMNQVVGVRMSDQINGATGTIQIPLYSKDGKALFRQDFGRKFRIFLGGKKSGAPIRVLYHIETEFDDGTSSARGILEAFTEEFQAFTTTREENRQETKSSWPTGIWIRESQPTRTFTQQELESQGLYQAGFCVDSKGNMYQVYASKRFPAFTETRADGSTAIYHTDASRGIKITERNNSTLDTLKEVDEDTTEQTSISTDNGTILGRNIFKRK